MKNELLERNKVIGRLIGMKEEASAAQMRLLFRKMMQEIGGDSVNYSILLEKYGDLCKVVYENSDSRIRYWMNEAEKGR